MRGERERTRGRRGARGGALAGAAKSKGETARDAESPGEADGRRGAGLVRGRRERGREGTDGRNREAEGR